MSPIDRKSVTQKLIRLDRVIDELDNIRKTPKKIFVDDLRLQAATERYLILGIEIVTDIANHLLVELAGSAGTSYEHIIAEIGRTRIVPRAIAKRNIGMARFRNLLVHAYEVIDPELIHSYIQKAPKEFRAFAKAFAKHL